MAKTGMLATAFGCPARPTVLDETCRGFLEVRTTPHQKCYAEGNTSLCDAVVWNVDSSHAVPHRAFLQGRPRRAASSNRSGWVNAVAALRTRHHGNLLWNRSLEPSLKQLALDVAVWIINSFLN